MYFITMPLVLHRVNYYALTAYITAIYAVLAANYVKLARFHIFLLLSGCFLRQFVRKYNSTCVKADRIKFYQLGVVYAWNR